MPVRNGDPLPQGSKEAYKEAAGGTPEANRHNRTVKYSKGQAIETLVYKTKKGYKIARPDLKDIKH